ncbi:MAG: hypothetical protein NTZ46_06815 [Verrucomicrobia bacterium]|nr:hypothetical protein [Verrucomicrobiota bacterium]
MKTPIIACLLLFAGPVFCTADPAAYAKGVVAKPVLVTGTTAEGAPIVYPKTKEPEVK